MSVFADALQPMILDGFYHIKSRQTKRGIFELIEKPGKVGYYYIAPTAGNVFQLQFSSLTEMELALAHDATRFARAAFQSLSTICAELMDKDGLAWGLVKLYYAAFYAGHTSLRLQGESCTYLENSAVTNIRKTAAAQGVTSSLKVDGGLYHIKVGTASMVLSPVGNGNGGSHEAFWTMYRQFLEVPRSRPYKANFLHLTPNKCSPFCKI